MENKKTFKVLLISITVYMLLSWLIVSGNFKDGVYVANGYTQFGLFDFLLAPLQLFNYYAVTMTKSIEGFAYEVSYINIILALMAIAIFYGVLNKTGAYSKLVKDITNKVKDKSELFLIVIAVLYCLISALTGLNLILFLFIPFVAAILMKLKYRRVTVFTATVGAMMIGKIGAILEPNINGLNRIVFQTSLTSNIASRIILLIMMVVILVATILLSENKKVAKEEEILFFSDKEEKNKSYMPIVVITSIMTIILGICMYNWYYVYNITSVTEAYNTVMQTTVFKYQFMNNILGMTEEFGYWTGFTMSGLLLLASLAIKFIYNIKFDDMLEGAKKGLSSVSSSIYLGIISLTLIVMSLRNSDSFVYTIINNIFNIFNNNVTLGVFCNSFLHSFLVNDYFATLSVLSGPLTELYGVDATEISVFVMQIGHGLASLVTPFNVFLISGLAYLRVSYTEWIKYIWKTLVAVLLVSIIVIFVTV